MKKFEREWYLKLESEEIKLDGEIIKLLYSLDKVVLKTINRNLSKNKMDDRARLIIYELYIGPASISVLAHRLEITSEIVASFVQEMEHEGIVKKTVIQDEEMISLTMKNLVEINESLPEIYNEWIKNYLYEWQ